MPSSNIEAAAILLAAIRRGQTAPIAALPATLAPRNEDEAYAIQQAVLGQLQARGGGWKATMLDGGAMLSAPIVAGMLLDSPARLTPATTATRGTRRFGIEPELAFRLRQALPPRPGALYRRAEVLDAVDCAHAVIEICASRFVDNASVPSLDKLADGLVSEALVLGPPCHDWRDLDLTQLPLRLRIDGELQHEGRGGHPLGDPLMPLLGLANHLAARGIGLRAGDVVTTGSFNGIRWLDVGQRAQIEFAGLGTASVDFDG